MKDMDGWSLEMWHSGQSGGQSRDGCQVAAVARRAQVRVATVLLRESVRRDQSFSACWRVDAT